MRACSLVPDFGEIAGSKLNFVKACSSYVAFTDKKASFKD
jgi:hypothetical protein